MTVLCHKLQRTEALERSLTQNVGWKKLIRRGICTLKKPQYQVIINQKVIQVWFHNLWRSVLDVIVLFQLCYVDPGIATGEDMEKLKTLKSAFFEL